MPHHCKYTGDIVNVYVEQKYTQNNENFIIYSYTPKSRQNKSPEQQCQQ